MSKGSKQAGVYERKPGSGIWYIRYYDEYGTDRKKKVGEKKTEAQQLLRKVKEDVRLRKLGLKPSRREEQRLKLTVAELIERYRPEFEAKKSGRDNKRFAKVWKAEVGHLPATDVRPGDIEAWRQRALLKGLKPNTVNGHTSFLRRIFNLGIRDELVLHNPIGNGRVPALKGVGRRERVLSSEEEGLLLQALEPRDQVAFIICLYTGLRRGEVMRMRRQDIDLNNRIAHLPHTKAGRPQSIMLSGLVFEAITWLMSSHEEDYLFPDQATRRHRTDLRYAAIRAEHADGLTVREIAEKLEVAGNTVRRALGEVGRGVRTDAGSRHATGEQLLIRLKRAAVALGLKDVLVHTLRHTFVTRIVGQGTDIGTAKDLARHSTITMTNEYVHKQDKAKREAVELLAVAGGHHAALFSQPGQRGHLRPVR